MNNYGGECIVKDRIATGFSFSSVGFKPYARKEIKIGSLNVEEIKLKG
jgi:hypothetical protein